MKFLQLYFSFTGRLSLKHFWLYWNIPVYLGGALLSYFLVDIFSLPNVQEAIGLFLIWPFLATSVKRLHDRDLSGWFLLLHLIPILGTIILLIPIYLTPGTEGENRFDPSYKERHPEEFQNNYRPVKKIVSFIIAFQVLCFFGNKSILSLIYTDGPYYGRVVDSETGEPIPGAVVAGVWKFGQIVPFLIIWTFADANETVTDSEGKFKLPREWTFTPWIMSTKMKLSDLYVFKSGYDSHPPNMDWHWKKEDEKRRNITTGEYQKKFKKRCESGKECIVKLTATETNIERVDAYRGAVIDEMPIKYGYKIRNYISIVNVEGDKIGANRWPVE